ncbi:EamA family transporter [Dactylosporangium vinaceum]|uniref:DMT family transporter n=1 Tax=Dactylosporangium vinaceum TaxID=53362 RepID=A0ABV5MA26_9ACTN|nr:DMT family transporter [Dactylosporangium vinaceum]UAB93126.1 EamA family transporter [Dactylosporangium vinaceum]
MTGLAIAVLASAMFGTSGAFADALMATGWTPGALVTVRVAIAALVLTPFALRSLRGRFRLLRAAWGQVLSFGAVAVAGCQLFYFNAVQRLDIGVALLLEYSGILLVVLWAWLRHAQRPRRLTIAGGAAALGGLVLVLNPGGGGLDPLGVVWGILAGTGLAGYFVMAARGEGALPPIALAWSGMVVGAAGLAAFDVLGLLPWGTSTADVTLLDRPVPWWLPIAGLSVVAGALAYATSIMASRLLGAKVASFTGLLEVLFAILFAWLALGQRPGPWQLAGGLVVLAGIALVKADESTTPVPAHDDREVDVPEGVRHPVTLGPPGIVDGHELPHEALLDSEDGVGVQIR